MDQQAKAFCVVGGTDCYAEVWTVFFSESPSGIMHLRGDIWPHVISAGHKERIAYLHFSKGVLRERLGLFAF